MSDPITRQRGQRAWAAAGAAALWAAAALVGCGRIGTGDSPTGGSGASEGGTSLDGAAADVMSQTPEDATVQGDGAAEAEGDASGPPCVASTDCDGGASCLYRVGDCAAKGQCLSMAALGPSCKHIVAYCGCDGTTVGGLCGPPYAYGPTLGQSVCSSDAGDSGAE